MKPDLSPDTVVDWLEDIFEAGGGQEYLGEPVTQAEHMLQGAKLAEDAGQSDEVIAAALLHDIGHLIDPDDMFSMDDEHDRRHEESGAAALEPFFPPLVTACIRHHVAAKRYLCATRPDYHDRLSVASKRSLMLQGGPMSEREVEVFSQLPYVEDIIRIRHLDDAGKRTDMEIRTFADYKPMLQRMVAAHCGGQT